MDIVFVYNYTSKLKFVLPIKHLHQICPVDVFANIAGDYPFPGPVYSRLRHFGEAEQLRLRAYTTIDRKSTCSSVSALLVFLRLPARHQKCHYRQQNSNTAITQELWNDWADGQELIRHHFATPHREAMRQLTYIKGSTPSQSVCMKGPHVAFGYPPIKGARNYQLPQLPAGPFALSILVHIEPHIYLRCPSDHNVRLRLFHATNNQLD